MNNVVQQLKDSGFAISHIDELFNDEQKQMFNTVDQWYQSVLQEPHVKQKMEAISNWKTDKDAIKLRKMLKGRGKFFYLLNRDLLNGPLTIRKDIPLIELYTQDILLDIVKGFLGKEPKMFSVITHIHPETPNTHKRVASQNWHRDSEDDHAIKIFFYFNDVTMKQGPTCIVPNTSHPVNSKIPPGETFSTAQYTTGPKGTVVFFDGTNIHKGGFIEEGFRLMTQALYLKPRAKLIRNGYYHCFNHNKSFINKIKFKSPEYLALSKRAQKVLR